jgi:hypothetical protein
MPPLIVAGRGEAREELELGGARGRMDEDGYRRRRFFVESARGEANARLTRRAGESEVARFCLPFPTLEACRDVI